MQLELNVLLEIRFLQVFSSRPLRILFSSFKYSLLFLPLNGDDYFLSLSSQSFSLSTLQMCLVFILNITAIILSRKWFMVNYIFKFFNNFNFELMDRSDLNRLGTNRQLVNIIAVLGATVFLVQAYIVYTKLVIAAIRYIWRKDLMVSPAPVPVTKTYMSPTIPTEANFKPPISSTPGIPLKGAKKWWPHQRRRGYEGEGWYWNFSLCNFCTFQLVIIISNDKN